MRLLRYKIRWELLFSKILLTFSLRTAIIAHVHLFLIFLSMSLTKSLYATIATLFVAENALAAGADTMFGLTTKAG